MLERLQVDLEITEGEDEAVDNKLNDKINDAYGFIYAFSNFVSPLGGSLLYSQFGQRITFDFIWIFDLCLAMFLFIFNCGLFVFSENKKFYEKLDTLKAKLEDQSVDITQHVGSVEMNNTLNVNSFRTGITSERSF